MEAIGVLAGVAALFVLVLVVVLTVSAVKAGRAMGRRVEQRSAQARRAVEDVTLKARSYAQPGPQGRIAAIRLEVRGSLTSTRRVLETGVQDDPQLTDALRLLDRLDEHARELDGELRMLEREPESERVGARLPGLSERAERIAHSANSLRWAAQDRAQRFSDDELARLGEECESEADALRHWTPADPAASRHAGPDRTGAAGRAGGAEGPRGAGGSGRPDRAGGSGGAGEGTRPGLPAEGAPPAAEALGLAEPLARIAGRLRATGFKRNPGSPDPR